MWLILLSALQVHWKMLLKRERGTWEGTTVWVLAIATLKILLKAAVISVVM